MTIQDLASQCVRCGLCLPHCPTYRLGQEEPESPRGRIQMFAAFAEQELEWHPPLQQHVDQCLSCGHCERVCPIPVSYEHLLVQGREALEKAKVGGSRLHRFAIKMIETPSLRNFLFTNIRLLQTLNLWNFLEKITIIFSPKLARAMSFVPPPYVIPAHAGIHVNDRKMDSRVRGNDVLLFPGCTGENFGKKTFEASKQLLTLLGFDVHLPPQAWCCGALSAHAGFGTETTEKTSKALLDFCEKENIQTIISFATGCGGWMKKFAACGKHVTDIQQFLLEQNSWERIKREKKLRVAVHSPCTQTNALKNSGLSFDLLSQIPDLELIRFGEKSCCGAAGTYMFEHPEISEQLVQQLLTPDLLEKIDLIVTSNIGCQLQFQHFLREQGKEIPVVHPVELCLQYVSRTNVNTTRAKSNAATANESAIR